ncbi:Fc.00g061390.m01.CDS01 [Cosmosporella sp. VM-42]
MSYKRSRTTYEADFHAPFAVFGTPLPDEADARDDGSYLPLWKQEVRDERGRKRLHGAFTGGFSAGYFNTVGSKEGWTPSTFVSSRNNRNKDASTTAPQQRPEDYMDEEDLADAAESQKLQTSQAFAGLGSSTEDAVAASGLMGLFRANGDTMGFKLLRKMGWKDGQGIGPRVRRSARLDVGGVSSGPGGETHLFAPEDAGMIQFVRKVDRKGLGHDGEDKLASLSIQGSGAVDEDDEEDVLGGGTRNTSLVSRGKPKPKPDRGGIGVGILNDNGSDDEDPYEIGPRIKYNRIIGGDKKKKKVKKSTAAVNPTLRNAPVFLSKIARAGNSLSRCHDGRLPLDGFVLAKITEDLTDLLSQFAPPSIPEDWKSSKSRSNDVGQGAYESTTDAAKSSTLDAKSRAAILGEKSLPGKSVFDYISSTARDRLAAGSGKKDLPPALGEIPEGFAMSEEEKQHALWDQAPRLDQETALAAISRGSAGPYADNEAKKARYRTYLEHFATGTQPLPWKPKGMPDEDFARELNEFYNCARIFKPMSGFMASRFTTAKKPSVLSADGTTSTEILSKPEPKIADPAEEAAKVGMYGKMTRSVEDFYPTRLLCKRFNVRPPEHVRPDNEPEQSSRDSKAPSSFYPTEKFQSSESTTTPDAAVKAIEGIPPTGNAESMTAEVELGINPEKNDAVEGTTAHDEPASPHRLQLLRENQTPRLQASPSRNTAAPRRPQTLPRKAANLSEPQESLTGPSVSSEFETTPTPSIHCHREPAPDDDNDIALSREQLPPPQYPASEASSSRPPPFSSLFYPSDERSGKFAVASAVVEGEASGSVVAAPAYSDNTTTSPLVASHQPFDTGRAFRDPIAETKCALPRDTKGDSSRKDDDAEPPPAYSEGDSPLLAFSFLMAAAGGASSIITQVQQGGPPVNSIGDVGADETIAMDLRGTRFYLSRDELLTLPEFVLLSLFPNGLFPEGHMSGFSDGDAVQVDYDPASLQYMLDFFRQVAQSIPSESSPGTSQDGDSVPIDPIPSRDDSKRAGIIVLREDLDFYAIPPKSDITQLDMIQVKRAAAQALQKQDGIFSGLKRSDEPGTTEAHLIEMLTAGGFNHDDRWGHRAGEPNKAVICSLALARLRSDIRGNEMGNNAVGMAQKLLLFWRKPARRCWWEGVELENVEGVEGKLKVWIRRVWTLEMSVIGLR